MQNTNPGESKTPLPPAGAGDVSLSDFAEKVSSTRRAKAPKPPPVEVVIPPSLDTPEFRAAWSDWIADRTERKKTMTARAEALALGKLESCGPVRAIEVIRASIANGWIGLFTETNNGRANHTNGSVHAHRQAKRERECVEPEIELPRL